MRKIIFIILLLFVCTFTYADGIDIFTFITNVPNAYFLDIHEILFFIILLFAVNYIFNYIIIIPGLLLTKQFNLKKSLISVLIITTLGQVIDRLAAGISLLLVGYVFEGLGKDLGVAILSLLIIRLIVAWILVFFCSYFILGKVFEIKKKTRILLCIIFGFLSNPIWGEIVLFRIIGE